MTQTHTAYFLMSDGHPRRFVLGEDCPCASVGLATFFPDLHTAIAVAHAHCNSNTEVMECQMTVRKACDAVPKLDCEKL